MSQGAESISVLHVDDQPDFADLAAQFLEREDDRFEVRTAISADEGWEILADTGIDCIISDYDMPAENGIQFLETVRETYPDLPFILYTGKGSEEIASEAISSGVSDYLQKESGTEQYTVLANRIVNLVTQYRAEIKVGRFRDLREESEEYRDRLLEIVSRKGRPAEEIIQDLLELGRERFDVENGHLVLIDRKDGIHNVISVSGSDIVREGISDLSKTYCRKTIESDEIQEINNAVEQGWGNDPAYEEYGIGCYLGSNLSMGDQSVGTVCFVDEDPREPFSHHERVFFDMLVRWFNHVLERRRLTQVETIFENAQDAIFIVDVEDSTFKIRRVNPAYEELTGIKSHQIEGRTPSEVVGEELGAGIEDHYSDCVTQKEPIEYEEEIPFEGETYHWQTRLAPIIENGTVTQLIGVSRDFTEHKKHLEQLREEQQFVQSLFKSLPDPIYAMDTDGYPIRWNDEFEEVSGYTREEIDGKHFSEFVPEEDAEAILQNFNLIKEERRSVTIESALETKQGDRIYHEFTGGPLEDADGTLKGVTGVGRDITERKQYEKTLKDQRRRFEKLLNTSPIAITILNTDGEIVRANERAEEVLGLSESELMGRTYADPQWEIMDEEGEPIPAVDLPFSKVIETGEPVFNYEHGIKWPDGNERWLSINATPITTESDEIEELIAVISDFTETREYERTIEAQNERLKKFSRFVSHDLRNPLNVAQGRVKLAQEECDSEHLDVAQRAQKRMETLITDLRTLSEESEFSTHLADVDLAEMTEKCWQNVETKDASVEYSLERVIKADERRLRQLFENLIHNAVEHGGRDVTVTIGELDNGFYIEDDGPGIPEEVRNDVFSMGYSTSKDGSGFGLNIVKQVVDGHNWDIRVTESSEGGARFEIADVTFATE